MPPVGRYCTVAPPPCKNDQDGSKYHDDPLVFEHQEGAGGIDFASLMCAANYLCGLENDFPLFEEVQMQKAPLFEHPVKKKPFTTKDFEFGED